MSSGRPLLGIFVCALAAMVATPLGLAMGGFGICATTVTPGLVGLGAVVGGAFGGTVAVVWRGAWWAGSVSFSLPLCLGLCLAGEAARVMGILVCALAAFLPAFVIRYPGPGSLKS